MDGKTKEHVQESVPIDEVESGSGRTTNVAHDKVDRISATTDRSVERTGPDLCVWREVVGRASDLERQRLQAGILR